MTFVEEEEEEEPNMEVTNPWMGGRNGRSISPRTAMNRSGNVMKSKLTNSITF